MLRSLSERNIKDSAKYVCALPNNIPWRYIKTPNSIWMYGMLRCHVEILKIPTCLKGI